MKRKHFLRGERAEPVPGGCDPRRRVCLSSDATNTATVTVNGNAAWRLGAYFYGGDTADNAASAVMKELEIAAVVNPPGTNEADLVESMTGRVFVARTPETFAYDDDGNLVQDGRFAYTWDGENRLIAVETRADLPAAVPRVRVVSVYDHQSRRIGKVVSRQDAGASDWTVTEARSFVYDGWNMIAEISGTNTTHYVWGLDLDGTLQGAGGVGGLLAVTRSDGVYLPCYDANGNITEYVSLNGEISAHYEYSPFGETVIQSGDLAATFAHRFSTKYFDPETDLYYYGYRFYGPALGRWLNRDPLCEISLQGSNRGGYSVMKDAAGLIYVNNNPLRFIDFWGLTTITSMETFCGAVRNKNGTYSISINDGWEGTVELKRITMGEIEAEKKALVDSLQSYKRQDGCKSRRHERLFDSKYFDGEKRQLSYYLVDGTCPIYAGNEINYIGIGLYEAWLCNPLWKAKAITWLWKVGWWHDTPSKGTIHWLEVGYSNYAKLKSADDTCCSCNNSSNNNSERR